MVRNDDVHTGERTGGLPTTVLELFSETDGTGSVGPSPPNACASCGTGTAIQWLRLVTDWEEFVCRDGGVTDPDGVSLVPLCNRCRAWAEIIEIAEMAIPHLAQAEANRIIQERNRFLETLDVNLIRGIRMSEELSSYSE
jgi:hypothetical protein